MADSQTMREAGFRFAEPKPNQTPEDRVKTSLFGDVLTKGAAGKMSVDAAARELWRRLQSHYLRELEIQDDWRREMEQDEAFYDGDQWDPQDIAILKGRGQEPMVFNIIAQSVNWIVGTERRGRTDYKILPRTKEDTAAAQRKSDLFKYLDQASMAEFHWSRAFTAAIKAGLGWMESGIQDEDDGEPIYQESASWRDIIFDSATSQGDFDMQRGRYLFRTKWVDQDVAASLFPEQVGTIRAAVARADEYGASLDRWGDSPMDSQEEAITLNGASGDEDMVAFSRNRLRLVEGWFRVAEKAPKIKGGQFSGEMYDPSSPGHVESVHRGEAEVREKMTFRTHIMIFCNAGPLWLSPSPYRHNRYPLTPIWAYRKGKDGSCYGVVRAMRDAQRDVNKRFSKAQYILNSQKVIMDEGAVNDMDELAEELARPDSTIAVKKGYRFEIGVDRELAESHLNLMSLSMGMIQSLSGVTDESMGRTTNATSGKAIIARQEQGALSTAPLFDNLRMARAFHGEKVLSLIEQFMTEEKQFRITNARNVPTWVTVNDGLPENDIARSKADYIVSETDWSASARQTQVEALLNIVVQLAPVAPQMALTMLDLIIDAMDIPNREEIVKRIRGITGAEDPDADPENPTPEMLAQQQAKEAQAAMEQRAAEANIAKLEGEAAETMARADKTRADAEKVIRSLPKDTLDNFANALQIAIQMLTAAGAVDTADALIAVANAAPQEQSAAPMAALPQPTGPDPMQQPQPQAAPAPMPSGPDQFPQY